MLKVQNFYGSQFMTIKTLGLAVALFLLCLAGEILRHLLFYIVARIYQFIKKRLTKSNN